MFSVESSDSLTGPNEAFSNHCYDCLTSAANLKAIWTFLSPLDGLDLNGESNSACRDTLFLRMLEGLGCSPSEAAADSGSLANLTMSVCSIMCSCAVKTRLTHVTLVQQRRLSHLKR